MQQSSARAVHKRIKTENYESIQNHFVVSVARGSVGVPQQGYGSDFRRARQCTGLGDRGAQCGRRCRRYGKVVGRVVGLLESDRHTEAVAELRDRTGRRALLVL